MAPAVESTSQFRELDVEPSRQVPQKCSPASLGWCVPGPEGRRPDTSHTHLQWRRGTTAYRRKADWELREAASSIASGEGAA